MHRAIAHGDVVKALEKLEELRRVHNGVGALKIFRSIAPEQSWRGSNRFQTVGAPEEAFQ